MARTALALLLASRAAALVPSLRSAAVATPKTVTQVSYLSEVEDADKKKKWWDQDDPDREESNPRDHTGIGEADSNYGPTNYEGFIDADGFDGGDGQVGVVGDGKVWLAPAIPIPTKTCQPSRRRAVMIPESGVSTMPLPLNSLLQRLTRCKIIGKGLMLTIAVF